MPLRPRRVQTPAATWASLLVEKKYSYEELGFLCVCKVFVYVCKDVCAVPMGVNKVCVCLHVCVYVYIHLTSSQETFIVGNLCSVIHINALLMWIQSDHRSSLQDRDATVLPCRQLR